MISKYLEIKIATPDGVVYEGSGLSVNLKTEMGEITVLPNHVPLISVIVSGKIKIKTSEGEKIFENTGTGILEVRKDSKIIILSDSIKPI